jgi:arginase
MEKGGIHWIGAACGWGAQIRSCEDGPETLLSSQGFAELIPHSSQEILFPSKRYKECTLSLPAALPILASYYSQLADRVFLALKQGRFPIVVGGDHSIGVGTWNGVGPFLEQQNGGDLGLIWIDAHMDAHTPQTTPSGAWHGMPLAALLGHGRKELSQLKRAAPVLKPEHLCLIGVRSFEEGEAALLRRLGVKIYFIDEVKQRGFLTVLREGIERVSTVTAGYGVSLDLDAIDPSEAPGVGSPEPNGLSSTEILNGIDLIRPDQRLKAFELVEFNPLRDEKQKTLAISQAILKRVAASF